jgi:hypothetical protein
MGIQQPNTISKYYYLCTKRSQILVYADDVNILGGSVYTIKENAEALLVASKEIGLEVNADKHCRAKSHYED